MATFNGSFCYADAEVIYSDLLEPADVRIVLQNADALGLPVSVTVRGRLAANGIYHYRVENGIL